MSKSVYKSFPGFWNWFDNLSPEERAKLNFDDKRGNKAYEKYTSYITSLSPEEALDHYRL